MLKRMLSVLLIFGILASGAFCAHAGVLTKKEQYDACVKDLAAYLNDEYTVDLEKLQTSFSGLGSYEHSVSFNLYIRVLTGVESGDYSYVTASINMLRRSPAFEAYLAEKESFGSIDALESYALGRSAEAEGKHEEAMQHYEKADNFFDSYERLTTLQFTAYEAQYQKAYEAYMADT